MDWSTILTALVSALLSGGGIAGVVFFRENKRARQLQNENTASAQWRELYDKAEAKVESQGLKIESLYKENKHLRDQNNDLTTQNAVLKIWKCKRIGCTDREPPFGSKAKIEQTQTDRP
ncbi:hypothetical protein [Alistipes sp.]|uniref:hypothetical protein n=1 Tax=Alistipes sp. TaxID=1872444 RepID=UPI003AF06B56